MKNRLLPNSLSFPFICWTSTAIAVLVLLMTDAAWSAGSGEPVARVNGITIYESELSYAVEASRARRLFSRGKDMEIPESTTHQETVEKELNRLIDLELIYQESLKHRFHGLVEESQERYQHEVKRLGGESRLISTLRCNDMSPDDFRKAIFRRLSIKRFLNKEVYSKIQVTENEISSYYELHRDRFRKPASVRLRQILIKAPSNQAEEQWHFTEEKAYRIFQEVSAGDNFGRIARRHSEDPESASTGGDMGPLQKDDLQAVFGSFFGSFISELKEGAVTGPIRSRHGFHIVQVVSTTPASFRSLEEVHQSIASIVRREKSRVMISRLINDLRSQAEIEIIKGSRGQPASGIP